MKQTRRGRAGADATYHEIGKAMRLMLSCNPTATEVLWLDEYTATSDFGRELVSLRGCFLSAARVRDAFYGYATSQAERLMRGPFGEGRQARREKNARHTMRLLWQGYELYTTGRLPIRVPDPDRYHAFGRAAGNDPRATAVRALLAEYAARFDDAVCALPQAPDEAPLDDLLQQLRRAHFDSPEAAVGGGRAL